MVLSRRQIIPQLMADIELARGAGARKALQMLCSSTIIS
jgi:hypothetical protein